MAKTLYKGVPQRRQALLSRDRRWMNRGTDSISIYGDGQDGNIVLTGTSTLTRDMSYKNLTVAAGAILNTDGYRIYVKDVITVLGTIRHPGVDATIFVGAGEPSSNSAGGGRPGNSGGLGKNSGDNGNLNTFRVTVTGPGGKGGDTATRTGGIGDFSGGFDPVDIFEGRTLVYLSDVGVCTVTGNDTAKGLTGGHGGGGGAGDASGAQGGGGGSGGGVIFIGARHIKVGDSGLVTTQGGAGAAGAGSQQSGGGGGGSGGLVVLLCDTYSGPDPVSPGGSGGAGFMGGDDGQDGSPGAFVRRFRDFKV